MLEINNRRSVREFSEEVVSAADIDKILRASMQAPSAKNQQPWKFIVLKNKKILKMITEVLPNAKMLEYCSFAILFIADTENIKIAGMIDQDMASSITLSLLEATSLGIGSCWCGIHPNTERIEAVKNILNLSSANLIPFSIVAYGYPKSREAFKFVDRYDSKKILNGEF